MRDKLKRQFFLISKVMIQSNILNHIYGSYASLSLHGFQIDWSKSYINSFWACLFDESDKRSQMVHYSEFYTEPFDDTDQVPTFEFAASADVIKLRLELLGYMM